MENLYKIVNFETRISKTSGRLKNLIDINGRYTE